MVLLCGIEEARRGPVIGPMVMAGVVIDEKDSDKLLEMGVKDSKQLSPRQREMLFEQIKNAVKDFHIIVLSPLEVDSAVLSKATNLNWLEADTSAKIIDKLQPDKAVLDCPSPNLNAYSQYVSRKLKTKKKVWLFPEHKADENHPVVAAASILAKVTGDRLVEEIKQEIGQDFGSGYPSDPLTKAFLEKNWDKYDFFRKSWSSYQRIEKEKAQKSLGEY